MKATSSGVFLPSEESRDSKGNLSGHKFRPEFNPTVREESTNQKL